MVEGTNDFLKRFFFANGTFRFSDLSTNSLGDTHAMLQTRIGL